MIVIRVLAKLFGQSRRNQTPYYGSEPRDRGDYYYEQPRGYCSQPPSRRAERQQRRDYRHG